MQTSRGNINAVPGNVNYTPSSYLNTVAINVRTHMPSGNVNTVPLTINLYTQWLYLHFVIEIRTHTLNGCN